MNSEEFFKPHNLEKNSFLWTEVRLLVAAVSLLTGGVPIVWSIFPFYGTAGLVSSLLILAWLISGLASAYLLYRWYKGGQTVFGGKKQEDAIAFLVAGISGINLGLAGLVKKNIGMSIYSGRIVFIIVGILYIWCAYHLYQRWLKHGKKLF